MSKTCAADCPSWDNQLPLSLEAFRERVWAEGGSRYRDLPWRDTRDPYAVLVSEVMLQQTQVSRVQKRWELFMERFPTVDALAAASTADVLEEWQGMGYNRRALALKRAMDICAQDYHGQLPGAESDLLALPGVGPSTAAGVLAFAFDVPALYLETNVRTVFLHELFPDQECVSDKVIAPLVQLACPEEHVRQWYYALLDYGAYLKQTVPNPSRRSAQYSKQSKFEGSHRQKRAELVRIVLAASGIPVEQAFHDLNQAERTAGREQLTQEYFEQLVAQLVEEGFFAEENGRLFS